MPTAAVPASGLASSITPTPAMPSGGTALTSAATLSFLANCRSSADTTCTPAAAQASTTSASPRLVRMAARSPPETPWIVTPKRLPVSDAASSATSMPLRLDSSTSAPAWAAMTPATRPTGPVPPRMTTREPASAAPRRCSAASTQATMAAAVV